jgi:phospholipid/cholesterol/gamma-HCH transport system substrate-binding protein
METRANYILVGAFTLAVIFGAFGFVYWFHHVGGTGERAEYRVAFQGPIGGLRTGAMVSFNGIRVGEVTALSIDPHNPRQALATISVEKHTPVRADTEVTLDYQGMTGIASLALRGGAAAAAPVTLRDGEVPLLTASPSAGQDLMQAARDTVRRLDTFIADNEKAFRNSMRNIESFTEILSRNGDKIEASLRNIESFTDTLSRNREKIDASLGNIESFTDTLSRNREKIDASLSNIENFTDMLARNREKIDTSLGNIETFTGTLARNSDKIDSILAGIDTMIGGPDAKGAVPQAARAIRNAAENLDRKIDGLVADGRRTFNTIERTIKNFDENPTRLIFGGGRPASAATSSGNRRRR